MFKKMILSVLLFSNTLLIAQNDAQLDKMTESTCDCISKKDMDKIDPSNFEMELGFCIIQSIEVLPEKERIKLDFTNTKKMQELGEAIGIRMVTKCPSVLMKITKIQIEKNKDGTETPSNADTEEVAELTLSGTIKDVKISDWVTVVLTDKNQKEYKVLWIYHFDGESDFISNPQLLKGKSVEITYFEEERYVPQMKEYVSNKILSKLAVK